MSLIQKLFINWIKNVKKNSKSGNEALTANIMEKSLKETFTGMKDEIKKHADEDLSPELIDTNKETKDQIAETLRDLLGAGIEDQKNTKSPICPGCGETHTTDDKTIQESVKEGEEIMKKAEESLDRKSVV